MAPPISLLEVQKHASEDSCWVVIHGRVYDATSILNSHPGGKAIILRNAGKDATKAFAPIHPPDTLTTGLPPGADLGPVDLTTLQDTTADPPTPEEQRIALARQNIPPPYSVQNIPRIAELAQSVLSRTAWAYYRSAGDDNMTFDENIAVFRRYWFRPRVMHKISQISTSSTMLGNHVSLPIFICPAAMARLGHPDGEMNLVKAAAKEQIVHGISINASCSLDEIMSVKQPDQALFFQIYLNRNRATSKKLLLDVETRGFKAVILTVDSVVPGKRELDREAKGDSVVPARGISNAGGQGVAHAISGYQDPDILWEDVKWIQSLINLPLIIKGIQCVEDAEKAFNYGVQGIVLSNHGGRSLDFAPPGMVILEELYLRRPDLLRKFEVYIDGGVTRGTDVLKALCLGAKAVGLGRAFLYANSVWGEDGCRRVIEILREEIVMGMQFLGVTRIDQLRSDLLRLPQAHTQARL